MSKTNLNLEVKFLDLCLPVIKNAGLELYDLEYISGSKTLRVFIMNPDSLTADLNDCVTVDKGLTEPFEENDWIPEDVILEVSSPGIYRKLKNLDHFQYCLNQRIKVKFRGEIKFDEEKKINLKNFVSSGNIIGNLISVEKINDDYVIQFEGESKKGEKCEFELNSTQIIKANCEPII